MKSENPKTKNEKGKWGMAISLLGLLFWSSAAWAVADVWYYETHGTGGLTIEAVLKSQCTGTPATGVSINEGATRYTFTSLGSGKYWRELMAGKYYLFQQSALAGAAFVADDSVQTQINTINVAGWVTNTRLGSGAVTDLKIGTATIPQRCVGSKAIGAAQVVDNGLSWGQFSSAFKGAAPDVNFPISDMQDTLRLMQGNWNSGTDFNMDRLDSLVKKRLLGLAFSPPCTLAVRLDAGGSGSVWAQWYLNTTRNDSAVYQYMVLVDHALPPYGRTPHKVDAAELTVLHQLMGTWAVMPWSGGGGSNIMLPSVEGTTYCVILAWDWQGEVRSSGWDSLTVSGGVNGVGTSTQLIGAPGYTTGMSGMQALRDMMNTVNQLQIALPATGGGRVMLWNYGKQAYGNEHLSIVSPSGDYVIWSCRAAVPIAMAAGSYCRWSGYGKLHLRFQGRMKAISGLGNVWLNNSQSPNIGGGGTAADTCWRMAEVLEDISSMAVDSTGQWEIVGWGTVDSMQVRDAVMWMEQ